HDFNNLLTVMIGNLEMLKRNLNDDPKSGAYLTTVSEAVDIGTQLVQRLLGFARRQPLNPSLSDLNALVSDTAPLVRSSVGASIDVDLDLEQELLPVFVDAAQLQNALLNLSINARDAMPNGGQITIETSTVDMSRTAAEQYPGAEPGRYLVLRVTDTGAGIEKEDLDKVVEPFFTTKDVGEGTGLGLSSVYGFAQQSNGFLLLDSEVGAGTTVSIFLPTTAATPVLRDSHHQQETLEPLGDPRAAERTVLVVEDDPNVRALTVSRLQHLGYQVLDADDATAALATLESQPDIDVLLTDIAMPGGMSGIDLAAVVSKNRPDIKIIFSASYSKQADILHEQDKLGSWLQKPYKQAELAKKMQEILATA
ncbi:MAG: ATP-binding protein, partial [Hyphomicrobiaceae bacterium]